MPTVQVTGLQILAVYVTDLARARAFYVDQLGFAQTSEMPPGVLLQAGGLTLYVEGGRPRAADEALKRTEVCPCLAVDSVRAAHARLTAAGVTLVGKLEVMGDEFAMFRVADPDGNLLEFAGRP